MILDGENCWEYYPDGGVSFLRSLYREAARDPRVRPVTVGEHLREHPPAETLPRLFSGSWISHNFAIWIGHPEDNRGWDALHDDPRVPRPASRGPGATTRPPSPGPGTSSTSPRGPTGSGGTATTTPAPSTRSSTTSSASTCATSTPCSASDPPGSLFTPISQAAGHRRIHDQPKSFLNVKVDGRSTYFEWINAAHFRCGQERGTMALVTLGVLQAVWFGFDAERLLIRVDTEGGAARDRLAEVDRLRIGFVDPADREIVVESPSQPRPIARIDGAGSPSSNGTTVEVGLRQDLRAGRPLPPARPEGRGPDPLLRRVAGGRHQPRPCPPRGDLRADRPVARFRADHVASLREPTGTDARRHEGCRT